MRVECRMREARGCFLCTKACTREHWYSILVTNPAVRLDCNVRQRSALVPPRRSPRQYPWAPRMHWLATHWLISLLHIALVAELETYDGQVGDWTGFDQVPT